LYVGNDSYYKILQKAADNYNISIDVIPSESLKDISQINIYISGYITDGDIIIVNFDCFNNNDSFKIIKESLKNNSQVCVLHKGYATQDKQVEKVIKAGVKFLLLSSNDKQNIKLLSRVIEGKYQENISYIQQLEDKKTKKNNTDTAQMNILSDTNLDNVVKFDFDESVVDTETTTEGEEYTNTIVVAGCVPRIGTTTVSIHMLTLLIEKGKKVCYIDRSGNNYIYWLTKLYGNMGTIDMDHNKYTLNNIDFYFMVNKNVLDYIYDSDYDYILYDVGVVEIEETESGIITKDKKKIKMLQEADYGFLCCGSKCNEYFATNAIITNNDCRNMYLMFYSVSKEDQEDMKSFCKQYCKKTCFVPYIDNEFLTQKDTDNLIGRIFK
jgi:hypothetical protein